MKLAGLVLLCLLGFLMLPLRVGIGFSDSPFPPIVFVPTNLGFVDWTEKVVRNVSGTGTYISDVDSETIVSDSGNSYRNSYPYGVFRANVTFVNGTLQEFPFVPYSKRVFFKIGLVRDDMVYIPEVSIPTYIVYQMQDLPRRCDVVSVCNSFCSRVGQTKYDVNLDFDGNGVINIRDVSTAARFFYLKFGEYRT